MLLVNVSHVSLNHNSSSTSQYCLGMIDWLECYYIFIFIYFINLAAMKKLINMLYYFTFRPVDCIRGFSRETLVEMTTNIESQEHRRRQNGEIGYAEHPRAGGTDDLETFFSIAHRYLGMLFSLKQFKEKWQKLVR